MADQQSKTPCCCLLTTQCRPPACTTCYPAAVWGKPCHAFGPVVVPSCRGCTSPPTTRRFNCWQFRGACVLHSAAQQQLHTVRMVYMLCRTCMPVASARVPSHAHAAYAMQESWSWRQFIYRCMPTAGGEGQHASGASPIQALATAAASGAAAPRLEAQQLTAPEVLVGFQVRSSGRPACPVCPKHPACVYALVCAARKGRAPPLSRVLVRPLLAVSCWNRGGMAAPYYSSATLLLTRAC